MSRVIHKTLFIFILTVLAIGLGSGLSFAITWTPNFSSPTHTVSQSSTSTDVTVTWDAMTPTGGTSADSYTYVWDNTSNTSITATKNPSETISGNQSGRTVTRTLTSETWYLHVRAVDDGGNWTSTEHFGPIIIDTQPEPTVGNISPTSGVNSSDTVNVTITGTYFKDLAGDDFTSVSAKIGTTTLTNVSVVSATSLTATYAVSNKTADQYDVTVTTDWGTSQPLTNAFTVSNPAPTVTSVSPTSGGNASDRTVTITGTGFLSTGTIPPETANPTVQMKDPDNSSRNFSLNNVTVVSKTSITATVPASKTPGLYDIVVTNSDGKSVTSADAYQVKLPAPTISTVSPDTDTNDAATAITITGTNYQTTGTTVVTLEATGKDTITCTGVSVTSATEISATIPKDKEAGTYDVKVTNPDSQTVTKSSAFTLNNPAPTVTAINPSSASNAATRSVTITGTGFLSTSTTPPGTANPTVQMRDPDNPDRNFSLSNITVGSKTSITATVPASKTAGTYDVVVTNSDSLSGTLTDGFEVTLPAPTVTSVSPASGTNEKTTSITITGTNFQTSGTTLVTLEATGKDTISCSSVSVGSSTEITAVVPANQVTGTYDLKVTNPDSQYVTDSSAFTVNNPVPTVTSISPASMTNNTTQSVTIVGTNFRSGPSVKIGTTSCTGVTLDSTTPAERLTCTVPASIDPDTYDVTVTNVGTDPGTLSGGFTVNAATTTVTLTYSASDTSSVPAGSLTITATFSQSQSNAPTISIDQQGSVDISDADMTATADDQIWTYTYNVQADDGSSYVDGDATVTIKSSSGTSISISSGSTFTIDTTSLSASITYAQASNTSGPFKAGDLTITVTLSASVTSAPKISINQQGSTDIADDNNLSGSGTTWTYTYTIQAKDGTTYKDGTATVSLKDSDSGDAAIPIGSGGTFSVDTTPPTVAITYAQSSNTSGPFKAGSLTITATLSENPAGTPQIAIDQAGTTDISATDMTATGSAKVWTHAYTVTAADASAYVDGTATVTITNGADSAGNLNQTATNDTFITDTSTTVAIDSVTTPTTTSSQVITGTKETGATVAVTVTSPVTAGTVTYPTGTTWSCTISSLQAGANGITATATDTAGNTDQDTASISYDGTAPQVSSATYVDTTHVDVVFSEAVSGGTTAARYTISGLTVSSVADQGSNTYRLTTSTMTTGQTYTVVVSTAMTDVAGNAVDSNNNSAQYTTGLQGDVNGDQAIDAGDAILVLRYSVGLTTLTSTQKWAGNVTSKGDNNDIDSGDAIKILRYSVGLITQF